MSSFPERYFINKASTLNKRARKIGAKGRVAPGQLFKLVVAFEWKCAYCGKGKLVLGPAKGPIYHDSLTIDHITPLYEGGTGDIANMLPACYECNNGKDKNPKGMKHPQNPPRKKKKVPQVKEDHRLLPKFRGVTLNESGATDTPGEV